MLLVNLASLACALDSSMEFKTSRRVEFRDTDAAGIMHFSVFFLYMEEAEHEFLRSLGLSVVIDETAGGDVRKILTWPRVHCECDYASPLKFEETVDIGVSITRLGDKSISYQFDFEREGKRIAQGKVTAVCCRIVGTGHPKSVAIPQEIRAKLSPFVLPSSH
jgi:acyl-CoA thioester hydrolase